MGGILPINNSHEVAMRKNQEYISEMNRIKMERWIQMHYKIRERERALQIAKNRELFYWIGTFFIFTLIGSINRYKHYKRLDAYSTSYYGGNPARKNKNFLGRNYISTFLIPLTFITAYYGDLAYGSKLHRIQAEAEMIMTHEPELLEWPQGLPTVSSIDEARTEVEIESKLHPHQT